MSKLDNFLQNASPKLEPLLVKPTPQTSQEGESPATGVDVPSFGALLQILSEKKGDEAGRGQSSSRDRNIPILAGTPMEGALSEQGGGEAEKDGESRVALECSSEPLRLEQALALAIQSEMPSALGANTIEGENPSSSNTSAAQKIYSPDPRLGGGGETSLASQSTQSTQSGGGGALSDLLEPLLGERDGNDIIRGLTSTPALKAAVIHQEAHFKPVLPGPTFSISPRQKGEAKDEAFLVKGQPDISAQSLGKPEALPLSKIDASSQGQRDSGAPISAVAQSGKKNDDASVPLPVVQRIAAAVIAEARSPAEPGLRTQKFDASPTITMKASEGVVRVLNIQLHPVELGLVTVKMRLSGDRLEMELRASSDETAKLLKSDSDKLSNLLKTSGYRPDVITIHSNGSDVSQQDSSLNQRQPSFSQSQQQSNGFHQGAANSDGQSHRQSDAFENSESEGKKTGVEEHSSGRSADHLYL